MDEAFGIPSEKSEMIALGTQNVVAHETGIPDVVDPLGGSYYLEALTKQFESCVLEELDQIRNIGGMVKAIESGYIRKVIAEDAYKSHTALQSGEKIRVGVNKFTIGEAEPPRRPYRFDPEEEERQVEELNQLKQERDSSVVENTLNKIRAIAMKKACTENNLVPAIIEAVEAYATVGEICGALREVFGEYVEPSIL